MLYRRDTDGLKVMLVHPGGPYSKNKDLGAWSIPKGEFLPGEDRLAHARREFEEETGHAINGDFKELTPVRQAGGKLVYAFAVEGDLDVTEIKSNTIQIEFPPRSGKMIEIPEIDRGEWFDLAIARQKINAAQVAFIDRLENLLD